MINQKYSAKIQRFQELLITTLLGDIPTIAMGLQLRKLVYKNIFGSMGDEVFIQHGVDITGSSFIEIGNGVNIFSIKRRERNGKLRGGEGKNKKTCSCSTSPSSS